MNVASIAVSVLSLIGIAVASVQLGRVSDAISALEQRIASIETAPPAAAAKGPRKSDADRLWSEVASLKESQAKLTPVTGSGGGLSRDDVQKAVAEVLDERERKAAAEAGKRTGEKMKTAVRSYLKEAAKKVKLTADEQASLAAIHDGQIDALGAVWADKSLSSEERTSRSQDVNRDAYEKVKGLLGPERHDQYRAATGSWFGGAMAPPAPAGGFPTGANEPK